MENDGFLGGWGASFFAAELVRHVQLQRAFRDLGANVFRAALPGDREMTSGEHAAARD